MRGLPPELTLGDPRLDAQHAYLFQLLATTEANPKASPTEVGSLVKAMLTYCKVHFTYEEALMREAGWLQLPFQELDHQRILNHCMDLAERIGHSSRAGLPAGVGGLTQPLIAETLRAWLTDHIMRPTYGDVAFVAWERSRRETTKVVHGS